MGTVVMFLPSLISRYYVCLCLHRTWRSYVVNTAYPLTVPSSNQRQCWHTLWSTSLVCLSASRAPSCLLRARNDLILVLGRPLWRALHKVPDHARPVNTTSKCLSLQLSVIYLQLLSFSSFSTNTNPPFNNDTLISNKLHNNIFIWILFIPDFT